MTYPHDRRGHCESERCAEEVKEPCAARTAARKQECHADYRGTAQQRARDDQPRIKRFLG
jgi:hypothetical protein